MPTAAGKAGGIGTRGWITVDDVLLMFGKYGRYQLSTVLLLSVVNVFWAWHLLSTPFIAGVPPYTCKIDQNKTTGPVTSKHEIYRCEVLTGPWSNETTKCTEWIYPNTAPETIVTTFQLFCNRGYIVTLSTSLMFIGVNIGGRISSTIGDRLGRKIVLLLGLAGMTAAGTLMAVMPEIWSFVVLRIILGFSISAAGISAFILRVEWLPPSGRIFGIFFLGGYSWSIGVAVLAALAYFVRNWRYIQLAVSLPGLLTFSFIWLIPESLHWIVAHENELSPSKRNFGKGMNIIRAMSRSNNIDIPTDLLDHLKALKVRTNFDAIDEDGSTLAVSPDLNGRFESVGNKSESSEVSSSDDEEENARRVDGKAIDAAYGAGAAAAADANVVKVSLIEKLQSNMKGAATKNNVQKDSSISDSVVLKNGVSKKPKLVFKKKASPQKSVEENEWVVRKYGFTDICKHPVLRRELNIFSFIWFADCCFYYGIALVIVNWPGNRYLIFALFGLLQIPADAMASLVVTQIGRRKSLFVFNVLGTLMLLLATVVNTLVFGEGQTSSLQTVFGLLAKCLIESAINLNYLYSAEMFPTVVRQVGAGCINIWARLGSAVCPFILLLNEVYVDLPYIIFSVMTGTAAVLTLMLREVTETHMRLEDVTEMVTSFSCCQQREEVERAEPKSAPYEGKVPESPVPPPRRHKQSLKKSDRYTAG